MRPAGRRCAGRRSRRPARGEAFTELFHSTPSPRASGTLGTHPKGVARDGTVRAGARGFRGCRRPEQRRKVGVDRLPLKFAGGQRSLNTFASVPLPERRAAGGAAGSRLSLGLRRIRLVVAEPCSQVIVRGSREPCCCAAQQVNEDSWRHLRCAAPAASAAVIMAYCCLAVAATAHAFQAVPGRPGPSIAVGMQAGGSPKGARSTPRKNPTKNGFRKGQ